MSLEELVQQLINDGKGDVGRLKHILSTIKKGQSLYASDEEYLEKLLAELRKTEKSEQVNENQEESESENTPPKQLTEIELLRKEIHKLQDRNHVIEEHLRNQKSGSMGRAFGRGIAAVFLFLFGLGMVFLLNHYFNNIDDYARGMYYGGDPFMMMIYFFVIIPIILLSIGGTSIYYGIRIISKT